MPDGDKAVAEEGDTNIHVHPEGAHQTPDGSHEAEDGHIPGIVEHAGAVRRNAVGVQPKIPAAASILGIVALTPLSAYLGVIAYFPTPDPHVVAPSGSIPTSDGLADRYKCTRGLTSNQASSLCSCIVRLPNIALAQLENTTLRWFSRLEGCSLPLGK